MPPYSLILCLVVVMVVLLAAYLSCWRANKELIRRLQNSERNLNTLEVKLNHARQDNDALRDRVHRMDRALRRYHKYGR